jgi:hypothetical protein
MRGHAFRSPPAPTEKPASSPAPRVKLLPPSAFAQTWRERPREAARVGLRLVGEKRIEAAESHARAELREARARLEGDLSQDEKVSLVDRYNTALMQFVLAEACCDADNVEALFFPKSSLTTIEVAFPPHTLLALWEEYEALAVATSPARPQASPDDLRMLAGALLELADAPAGPRILRLARLLLDEMRGSE